MIITVKVTPKSGKHEISGKLPDGTLKIKLKNAPEHEKANKELIELLSEYFKVPTKNITIKSGRTSARKTILLQTP